MTKWPEINYCGIRMIVSDLDGTLKRIDAPLDPELPEIIERLQGDGIIFTIATGKNLKSTRDTARALRIKSPLILANGCRVQELGGAVLKQSTLPSVFTEMLITECGDESIELAIHIGEEIYVRENTFNTDILLDYGCPKLTAIGDWAQVRELLPGAYKCIALDRNDRQRLFELEKRIHQIAGSSVEYCHTLVEMLEFMPRGVSKISGIQYLADKESIPFSTVVAMGDGNNDIGMIETAGVGIATADAPQEVQAAADWIVPSCEANGPREFLAHILDMRD